MDKDTSEIAKLTVRISKDPKSKLFVPLAEEYKKAGDIEMAIHVLLEGLKSNPEYVTARSSLGKLLFAKGDLTGAQKEFEEVVKTVPDNFMARIKLGDLYILQNRPMDALSHYKAAHKLNPGDGELASLISDVESGRDVRSKIQMSKARTLDEQAVRQEPPETGVILEPAPGPVHPQTANVEPKTPIETPLEIPSGSSAPAQWNMEQEEPEEVLFVEPLEPEASTQEPPVTGITVPGEQDIWGTPSAVAEELLDFDFSSGNQFPDEPVVEEVPESSFADISEKSDDFTTDTLAELYISQGFHEKAVEIYERMLVDKPNSRGLQEKLAWVRAEVARAAAPASEQKMEEDILAPPEAGEYVPVAEAGDIGAGPPEEYRLQHEQEEDAAGFMPGALTEAGEQVPTVEPEEMLIEAEIAAEPVASGPEETSPEEIIVDETWEFKPASGPNVTAGEDEGPKIVAASPAQEQESPKPARMDFEPREYVPSDVKQELSETTATNERASRVLSNAGRKETIARLESWLTTIKKEK